LADGNYNPQAAIYHQKSAEHDGCVCVWFIIGFATKSFGGLWSWKVLAPEAMISDPKQHLTDNLIFFATMVPGFF